MTATETPMEEATEEAMDEPQEEMTFTLEELSKFDGQNDNPAYVAVDGVVYDVTEKPLWAGGEHQNKVSAGKDLSEEINKSPHGKAKLQTLPIVGKLVD